jgi:hypothetical protein
MSKDICEFASCVKFKNDFKTICELSSKKCHNNFQDKTWCREWKHEQENIKARLK